MTATAVRRYLACDTFRALAQWLRRTLSPSPSSGSAWPPRHPAEVALMERDAQVHRHPVGKQRVKVERVPASAPVPDQHPPKP